MNLIPPHFPKDKHALPLTAGCFAAKKKCIRYLPHKAVAEVSKDKDPIGTYRKRVCGVQVVRKSVDVALK